MKSMLERIKIMLDIKDNKQDEVLDIFISNVTKHLLALFKKADKNIKEVPEECDYIIEEITIRRYNRVGSEGFKSESVEGHRVDFYDLKDEFYPYLEIIDGYRNEEETTSKRGKVMFL